MLFLCIMVRAVDLEPQQVKFKDLWNTFSNLFVDVGLYIYHQMPHLVAIVDCSHVDHVD